MSDPLLDSATAGGQEIKFRPHPEFSEYSDERLNSAQEELEKEIRAAEKSGDALLVAWFSIEMQMLNAERAKRNGHAISNHESDDSDPIQATLQVSGLADLTKGCSLPKVEEGLRNLALWLNDADPIRRATVREAALHKLDEIGISAPARLVDAALSQPSASAQKEPGQEIFFEDPEPWASAVDGAQLLGQIFSFLERFAILPPHAAKAITLWILHAYALEAFNISPILAITSPTKRAGKTTLVELVSMLAPRAVSASNITPASLFRAVEKFKPTLFIDEADTFLRESDELRGVLNASHRKSSAYVVRTVGDEYEPKLFSTWCAKAIALIGKLAGTLEDRAILIQMRRRAVTEVVERFRLDKVRGECEDLKRKAARWKADHLDALREIDPEMPGGLNDRACDNWRPLVAVADLAAGEWPAWARMAALFLSENSDEAENSALIQLLEDLKDLFSKRGVDRLSSAEIVEELGAIEERPWVEWRRGKPLTQRQLAKLLSSLSITPRTIRIDAVTAKGYLIEQFSDPFARYLPLRSVTPSRASVDAGLNNISDPTQKASVTDRNEGLSTREQNDVTDVTDQKGDNRAFEEWEEIKNG
jgi:putative DNA primase/helicase